MTVRGPYKERRDASLNAWNKRIRGALVRVRALGTFFEDRRNTVFFKCSVPEMREVWHKPDFNEFNPHISLYDGPSRSWAERILRALNKHDFDFAFIADSLIPLISGHGKSVLDNRWILDTALLGRVIGDIDVNAIFSMSEAGRLTYIERVGSYLSSLDGAPKSWERRSGIQNRR